MLPPITAITARRSITRSPDPLVPRRREKTERENDREPDQPHGGTSVGMAGGSLSDDGRSLGVGPRLTETLCRIQAHAPALILRCHRSSATVQPGTLTFSQRRVGPGSYRLASSLAT